MTNPSPIILETNRLLLRPLTLDDLPILATLYRDPDIRRFFPEGTLTEAQTKEELEWIINVYYEQYGFGLWATIHKATDQFIGRCGLIPWTLEGQKEVEVAYLLDKAYWGQGLATEVAEAIRDYGFTQLGLSRLICLIDPGHYASRRVAEKIGMFLEQSLDGIDGDGIPTLIYAMTHPA